MCRFDVLNPALGGCAKSRSDGNTTIMVVVDRLSKSAHLVPLSHPYTAKKVAAKFVDAIVRLHGMPRLIMRDRDSVFVSLF